MFVNHGIHTSFDEENLRLPRRSASDGSERAGYCWDDLSVIIYNTRRRHCVRRATDHEYYAHNDRLTCNSTTWKKRGMPHVHSLNSNFVTVMVQTDTPASEASQVVVNVGVISFGNVLDGVPHTGKLKKQSRMTAQSHICSWAIEGRRTVVDGGRLLRFKAEAQIKSTKLSN